jgi:hypothetical protein
MDHRTEHSGGSLGAVGLVVGVLGTLVSVLALFYAFLAARRSDALLRRLVVYPFRDLDIHFAALTDTERSALTKMYAATHNGHEDLSDQLIADIRINVPALSSQMLAYLEEQHWIERTSSHYHLNRDRLPYLHFLQETEGP